MIDMDAERAALFVDLLDELSDYSNRIDTDPEYTKEQIQAKLRGLCRIFKDYDLRLRQWLSADADRPANLDSSTEKRLDICNRMLDGADMAQACIMFDHELLAKYVREHAETIREQATVITDLNSRISELELELRDASHELRQRNVASDKNVGKS